MVALQLVRVLFHLLVSQTVVLEVLLVTALAALVAAADLMVVVRVRAARAADIPVVVLVMAVVPMAAEAALTTQEPIHPIAQESGWVMAARLFHTYQQKEIPLLRHFPLLTRPCSR